MANNHSQNNSSTRVVFVGNIPYDTSQEQIIQVCEEIGPVVSFRMVTDKDTGRPKGYGFCEYRDQETALSARRNLNGYNINGRQLRVDSSKGVGGADSSSRGGPGFVVNVPPNQPPAFLNLPSYQLSNGPAFINGPSIQPANSGFVQPPPQQPTSDPLMVHLMNRYSPKQLSDILSEMRGLATHNQELARQILTVCPGLPRAILQAHSLVVGGSQFPLS